jgi:glycosyltransferase involved in cell wall biosynthesis
MTPLVYVLHSGNLYGTERMALATAEGLASEYEPVIFAPPGPALDLAKRMGFGAQAFTGARDFAMQLRPHLGRSRKLAFFATGVAHSLAMLAWNLIYRRKVAHLHLVHGGADEHLSYGRKRRLNGKPVRFVAVSGYVRERLRAHHVADRQISVVENFLPDSRVAEMPRRGAFREAGIRRAIVISRIDPIKRVDLLLDAVERYPVLARIPIRVFGTGWELEILRKRAQKGCKNVEFAGFSAQIDAELAKSDLLIHLCPSEPFGLAILEAMAAGVPVLVPNRGGAGSLVDDGHNGFQFQADDADPLASKILAIGADGPEALDHVVEGGFASLRTRFSAGERLADYRRLIEEALA